MSNVEIKRYDWLNVARSLGAFFVILIHVSDPYAESAKSIDLFNWMAVVFWNVIPRSAVPLFVACSGYVLLEKEDSVTKRICKLVKPLAFWSLLYALLSLGLNYHGNSLFVKQLLLKNILGVWALSPHLWFMYMLLGLYVSLPLSRIIFKYSNTRILKSLIIAFTVNAITYYLVSMWKLKTGESVSSYYSLGLGWGSTYIGYFLLPKIIIDKQQIAIKNLYLWLCAISTIALVIYITFITSIERGGVLKVWAEADSILVALHAISLLLLLHSNELKISKLLNKFTGLKQIVELSSRYALGIYAVHYFFVRLVFSAIDRLGWQLYMFDFLYIAIPTISIIVWGLSLSVSMMAGNSRIFKQVV